MSEETNPEAGIVRVGLTGGIGSGKSTVSQMLQDAGAAIIDADAISRSMTAPNGAAIPVIADEFGAQFITPDGQLNRAMMRDLVFSDPQAKSRLEAIIHPLIARTTVQQYADAVELGKRCVVFDVPLLVESMAMSDRWKDQLDTVLVIDCEPETQIQRVMSRNGLTRADVEKIIAAQASRQQRLAAANIVIYNGESMSIDGLRTQVMQAAHSFGL